MADKQTKERSTLAKWSRRAFIGIGGLAGAGLVVGVGGYAWLSKNARKYSGKGFGNGSSLNAWLRIAPDNTITIAVPRLEMGQGVHTAIPMMIGEELGLTNLDRVKLVHPQPEPAYAGTYPQTHKLKAQDGSLTLEEKLMHAVPTVATGGSSTIFDGWWDMRYAGAAAKLMLVKAAAKRWGISPEDCYVEDAHVINKTTKEKLTYGELAEEAKSIKVEAAPPLKPKSDWKLMGKPIARVDIPSKVDGSAQFSLDFRIEGMLFGAIKHATYQDGVVESIQNLSEVESMPGVKKLVMLKKGKGAVVVASNTWQAIKASRAIKFKEEGTSDFKTADADTRAQAVLDNNEMVAEAKVKGNAPGLLDKKTDVEATYHLPYLAHACLEPMNAVALYENGKATIWTGTQTPGVAQEAAAKGAEISKSDVTLNVTYAGGGFGRRLEGDYAGYAAQVAKAMPGIPVQVMYTREECMNNDVYRPLSKAHFRAKLKEDGNVEAFEYKMAIESCSQKALMRLKPILAPEPKDDGATFEGFNDQVYDFDNQRLAFGQYNTPVELGFWRSVGYSQGGFYWESFIDECARAAGKDPLQYRKTLTAHDPRYTKVLDKIAAVSGWNTQLPEGRGRGVSIHKAFFTICAQVMELTQISEKEIKIDKVYAVVDCGQYVNPETIKSQIAGGIIFGLSAATYGEINFKDGIVEETNFPQYPMLRMKNAPEVEVHIMENDHFPGGIGEPGVAPSFSVLCNAMHDLTGKRLRSLPLKKSGYEFV